MRRDTEAPAQNAARDGAPARGSTPQSATAQRAIASGGTSSSRSSRDRTFGDRTSRRTLLASGAAATAGLLAGCLGALGGTEDDGGQDPNDLPTVEDPPDVVYVPSHREGTQMLEPVQAGDYVVGAMVSYAHPFWTITDDDVESVEIGPEDVHLMATVWDAETETVLPTDEGITMRVFDGDDELVDERSPWTMLSQPMGFHFGDNVPLDGDGTYRLEIELPSPSVRTTGAFEDRFESFETVSVEFTFDQALRDSLVEAIEYVDEDQRGQPGAIEPGHGGMGGEMDGGMNGDMDGGMDGGTNSSSGEMDGHDGEMDGHGGHAMPVAQLPAPADLPGTLQHDADDVPRSHDADVAVAVVDSFHGRSPYLLVSPRTPYNAIPLPSMTLSAVVTRDGSQVASGELVPSLDDVAGFHYGAAIADLEPGDELSVRFDAPPQAARHQGYETAFLDMTPVELTVEEW